MRLKLSLFLLSSDWLPLIGSVEEINMTTQLIRNISVALLTAASVYAQGSLTVQVPFGFHVGNSMLPAGEYIVSTDVAPGVVRVRSADAKSSVMVLSMAAQTSATPTTGKLVFNKYGDEYFLSQIWRQGSNTGNELRKSRREVEIAASARRAVQSILASQ
jgi:hypothetical protein